MRRYLPCVLLLACAPPAQQEPARQQPAPGQSQPAPTFRNGPPRDPEFFPLAVWLQSPHNAARYQQLGINIYLALYDGPTQTQLEQLDKAGMHTICEQNAVGLAHKGPTIIGWMHGDEPDNAQAAPPGKDGYDPPIPPARVLEQYERLRAADPTRPVLLNLGQGVAWDGWYGRGPRTNHPEDYVLYARAADIVSFDIYPVTHKHDAVKGKLEFVARGVQRLVQWSGGSKPVWACIETTHIDNQNARPTPEQVRCEVWLAIASGANGIVYFAHEFAPKFVEAGLLAHEEIAAAVREIDTEVLSYAPILNSPIDAQAVTVEPAGSIAVRAHRRGDTLHLFTAAMQAVPVRATFTLEGPAAKVEVLGERRSIECADRVFADHFAGHAVHHYRIHR